MAVKITLCLSVMLGLVASITCPTYTCESLGTNVCANKVTATSIQVNDNGCEDNYYCSGVEVLSWVQSSSATANSTFSCQAGTFLSHKSSTYYQSATSYPCPVPDAGKKFQSNQMQISCTTDSDCRLVDNTNSTCLCTFKSDTTGICIPSASNEDFLGTGYSRDCGTNHTITDRNTAMYWSVYVTAWVLDQGTISCRDIFGEIDTFSTFEDQITTGASYGSPSWASGYTAMALGSLGLLALH